MPTVECRGCRQQERAGDFREHRGARATSQGGDKMPILESVAGAIIKECMSYLATPLKDRVFPKNKAARKIMALYESIDECQEAYIKAIGWNSSNNIDDYDEKLRRVSNLIH